MASDRATQARVNTVIQGCANLNLDCVPMDRVSRGKRLLEQSLERVKRVRIEKTKITLQQEFLAARERLDTCVYMILKCEDQLQETPFKKAQQQNLNRLQDKRQLFLMKVIEAEEALLDFTGDE